MRWQSCKVAPACLRKYLMFIKYVISSSVFGQKIHTKLLKHGERSWWGFAAPPCLKGIIHDGNKISNSFTLWFKLRLKPTKNKNKTKQTKNKTKQTQKNMVNFTLIFVEDTSLRDVFLWLQSLIKFSYREQY